LRNGKQKNTKNQGTSQPEASQQFENGDMAKEWEELVELDDVQLATVVGGLMGGTVAMKDCLSEEDLLDGGD
jgi:hypothetical protein